MLDYVKSHKYESDISFTASINSIYYFPFLQSTGDTSVLVIEKNHVYLLLVLYFVAFSLYIYIYKCCSRRLNSSSIFSGVR